MPEAAGGEHVARASKGEPEATLRRAGRTTRRREENIFKMKVGDDNAVTTP